MQESSPTPVFGSASTFGSGGGFGGFSGVADAAKATPKGDATGAAPLGLSSSPHCCAEPHWHTSVSKYAT